MYVEDFKLVSNKDIGPKDIFEMGFSRLCERCQQTAIFFIRFMVSAGINKLRGRVDFLSQDCHSREGGNPEMFLCRDLCLRGD